MVSFMEMNEASNQINTISLIIADIDYTLVEKHIWNILYENKEAGSDEKSTIFMS